MSARGGRTTDHGRGRGPGRGAARAGNLVDADLVAMITEFMSRRSTKRDS